MSFLNDDYELAESQCLEFKEAAGGLPEDIWETYSAFANSEGGEIVLGVHEDSETHEFRPVGVNDAKRLIDEFWKVLRNPAKIERDVMFPDGVRAVMRDGLEFVVISIPRAERGDKPVRVYSRRQKQMVAYVRRGTGDIQASDADLSLMAYDRVAAADRRPIEHLGLEALCPETVRRYRNLFAALKPGSPWVDDSDDDFLFHIGALTRGADSDLKPTRAGLLAFGYEYEITDYLPQYLLDYREETSGFDRWDDRVVSQSGDWSGNLVDFYLTVSQRLKRYFKAPFGADEFGMSHVSRNPVTEAANEAVVNALIHAYYGDSCAVKVILRPDKLVVTNPGGFLIDRSVAIAGGVSEARNPTLVRIFSFMGANDRAGSGLQKIWRAWCEAYGIEPVFEETHLPAGVRLTLPIRGKITAEVKNEELHPTAKSILTALSGAPVGRTSREVSDITGIPKRTVQMWLKQLGDVGLVTRVRENGSIQYKIS